jgi:hypothetical protein
MKILAIILSISIAVYPALPAAQAQGDSWGVADPSRTNSATGTGSRTGSGTSTNTSASTSTCTDSRGNYQGFTDNRCYNMNQNTKDNNQKNTQEDTKNTNDQGSQQSSMLGMLAIAGGMAMIAAGTAMLSKPPTAPAGAALIAAGAALLMAGMQAMAAAGEMANDAGTAGYNVGRLDRLGTYGVTSTGTNTATGGSINNKPNASGVKIDPSLLRSGKSSLILDDFEGKTGISRDELAQALIDGKTPAEIMAGNKKFGGKSADEMNKMLGDAAASNGPMSSSDAMDKLGLSAEDLAALGKNTGMSATGEENTYGAGGGAGGSGASRKPDSSSSTNFDGLFGGPKADPAGAGVVGGAGSLGLSPEVQAALDRNGITGHSIFQMVNSQYKKKTPMMFGVPTAAKPTAGSADNPFGNIGSGGKIEF